MLLELLNRFSMHTEEGINPQKIPVLLYAHKILSCLFIIALIVCIILKLSIIKLPVYLDRNTILYDQAPSATKLPVSPTRGPRRLYVRSPYACPIGNKAVNTKDNRQNFILTAKLHSFNPTVNKVDSLKHHHQRHQKIMLP